MAVATNLKAGPLMEQTRLNMMVVDRFTIKHYTYEQISKEVTLCRQIKLPFESIAADCLVMRATEIKQPTGEVVVNLLSKTRKTVCAVSGLSQEGKVYFKR